MSASSAEARATQAEFEGDSPRVERPSRWRDAALALSIAHFMFIQAVHGLLFERKFVYFNHVPVNRVSLTALLLNIFAMGAALWLIGRLVRRIDYRALSATGKLVICLTALIPLNFARTHYWDLGGAKAVALLKQPLFIICAMIIVLATIWLRRHAAKLVMGIYIVLSPMVLFTTGKIGWYLLQPPPQPKDQAAPGPRPARDLPQIVWLVLDELDQRIGFEARPPEIGMPELSRLYNESFHATNAFPPGGSTTYSMPALTLGREVRGADPISANDLGFNGTKRWSESETVFTSARQLGFSTALLGWFHPYSRILRGQVDRCEWYTYAPLELERGMTLKEAVVNQLCSISPQLQQRRLHIRNVIAAQKTALDFVTNSPAALTLLHLPGPHHPGIYDAKRERFTLWKYSRSREYLENLVLTDKLFGELRRAMEQSGTWTNTWLIVTSDHWWREAAHHDGKIDHRVPFIIKAAGQNQSAVYDKRFDTVVTYHLLLSILKGVLTSAAELPHWLDTYRTEPPAGYTEKGEPL